MPFVFAQTKLGGQSQRLFCSPQWKQAVLARTEESQPYFALFVCGNGRFIQTINVIAGEKLKGLKPI